MNFKLIQYLQNTNTTLILPHLFDTVEKVVLLTLNLQGGRQNKIFK